MMNDDDQSKFSLKYNALLVKLENRKIEMHLRFTTMQFGSIYVTKSQSIFLKYDQGLFLEIKKY